MPTSSLHKKKVLFIGYGLYGGGAEANVIHLSHYLRQKRIKTDFFIFKHVNSYKNVYKHKLTLARVISALPNKKLKQIEYFGAFIHILRTLYSVVHSYNYDVLASVVEYLPTYMTVLFGICFKKKTMLFIGENLHADLLQKSFLSRLFHSFCMRLSFYFSNKIVCVSRGLADSIQKHYRIPLSKISTIYNGADTYLIQRQSKKRVKKEHIQFMQTTNTICILGRLEKKKGHEILISALAQIKNSIPIRLVIIGSGSLLTEIKKQIVRLRLTKNILCIGFSQNPYSYISRSDLFVFPSLYEGFGNVVVEAMATGTPVLVSDCEFGPKEIIGSKVVNSINNHIEEHTYGLLFRMNKMTSQEQIACLKKALIAYFQNKERYKKRYSVMGIKRAEKFTHTQMCRSYYELITKVIS